MGVDRVVRGRDLLSSTARQIWLISELGGSPPKYCHAPLLLSEDGRKLSKRDGDLNIMSLRQNHTPEEIIGYLAARLGLGDGKPISVQKLLQTFDWTLVPKKDITIK